MSEPTRTTPEGGSIGRDVELASISALFDRSDPTPRAMVISGPAGIGKTTLWRTAIGVAATAGYRVLQSSPSASEMQLSFTTIRDLVDSVFDEVVGGLPPPQREVLEVVLRRTSNTTATDPGAIAISMSSALDTLAASAPLVIAIDDIQWIDAASASPLAYALRRQGRTAVRLLLAHRTGMGEPLGLDRIPFPVSEIALPGLPFGAVARLLRDRLKTTYARATLRRVYEATGGNPLHALELARAMHGTAALGAFGALPVPVLLRDLVQERLRTLPRRTNELLLAASATAQPTVDAVLIISDHADAAALDPAIDADVIHVDGSGIRFSHPLYASAVYDLASRQRRREVHRRYAAAAADPEERARHLALATDQPDDAIATAITEGGSVAARRGSPVVAAELLEHARRLTPAASTRDRRRRTLEQVDQLFIAGFTDRAASLVDIELAGVQRGVERARLLSRRARIAHFEADIAGSVSMLREALGEAVGDADLCAEIEEGLAWGLLLLRQDLTAAATHATNAVRWASAANDGPLLAEATAAAALLSFVLGRPWEPAMRSAIELEPHLEGQRVLRFPSFAFGYCLACADRDDEARAIFERLRLHAEGQGDEASIPALLNHLVLVETLGGRWGLAEQLGLECLERASESGQGPTQASACSGLALLAVRRGDLDAARGLASDAFDLAGLDHYNPSAPGRAMAWGAEGAVWALGSAALISGDPQSAAEYLLPLCSALLAAGIDEPGEVRALPDAVEALLQCERSAEVAPLLDRLEGWARRTTRPAVIAAAKQCRALDAQRLGDLEPAVALLADAAHHFHLAGRPYEEARALLLLGAAQRRIRFRRDARQTLQDALTIAEPLGAERLASLARDELGRIAGRAPSGGGLTPTEERVATLVAAGDKNREVAARLSLSEHTVEAALTAVYRKLGVRSRTELTRLLIARGS